MNRAFTASTNAYNRYLDERITMRKWVVAVLAAAMQTGAAAAAPESRTATPDEQASFFDWYNTHGAQAGRGLLRPQFNVIRAEGKRGKRRVTATVDGPAQRAV